MSQALGEIRNRRTIEVGQIGRQGWGSSLCLRHSIDLLFPPRFQSFQFGFCGFGEDTCLDGGHHVRNFFFRPGEGGSKMAHSVFAAFIQTPLIRGIAVRKFLNCFGRHQMLFEAVDDGVFQHILTQAFDPLTDRAVFFSRVGTIIAAHAAINCDA